MIYLLDTNHCSSVIFGDSAIENYLTVVSADTDFQRIQQAWDFPLENWHDLLDS
ncbi:MULTISPECIES: hypothetical protein [Sphaerospermopsis]|uniref:PilT protein domain protein n=1 Tax=Sphaerospermopsis reniformis TaxID=531300 RepID=A0A479ZW10_9CYAN|nr:MULTISPECIES: hypothetical protein [Sphaerospermopsis]GCL36392.1 PilT protein domain protein [Sphaerospermopsis reniformis]